MSLDELALVVIVICHQNVDYSLTPTIPVRQVARRNMGRGLDLLLPDRPVSEFGDSMEQAVFQAPSGPGEETLHGVSPRWPRRTGW